MLTRGIYRDLLDNEVVDIIDIDDSGFHHMVIVRRGTSGVREGSTRCMNPLFMTTNRWVRDEGWMIHTMLKLYDAL